MFCKDCGAVLDPQTNMCPVCSASANLAPGQDIASDLSANNYPVSHGQPYGFNRNQGNYYQSELNYIRQNEPTGEFFSGKSAKAKKKNGGSSTLVILIALMLVVTIIFAGIIADYKFDLLPDKNDRSQREETQNSQEKPSDSQDDKGGKNAKETLSGEIITRGDDSRNLEDELNNYIDGNFGDTSDVAVCVIDNKTNLMYSTNHSEKQYVAWGFYLPIYMALDSHFPGEYDKTREKIVSTDIALCNEYSNKGVDYIGGFEALNILLIEDYNLFATSFNRRFGDVYSKEENYTTAEDAAMMLKELNDKDDYAVLNHNNSTFGITSSSDENVIYAHYGSENNNIKRNFNVFSIVKGRCDCCIVIMSKNQSNAVKVANDIYSIVFNSL